MKHKGHLERIINQETGEVDDKRIWMVNNQILFTDDGFKTTKAALGEYKINDETYYGLLAQAVIAGYIEGSKIKGGSIEGSTIDIGSYYDDNGELHHAFSVDEEGTVTMSGGHTIDGYAKESDIDAKLQDVKESTPIISDLPPESARNGQLWLDTSSEPYVLMVYENNQWVYFSQQSGETVFTTQPQSYKKGDLWIVDEKSLYNSYKIVDDIAYNCFMDVWTNNQKPENEQKAYYTKDGQEILTMSYRTMAIGTPAWIEGDKPQGFVIDIGLHDNVDITSSPRILFCENLMKNELDGALPITSITISTRDGHELCHQSNVRYYGTDQPVNIAAGTTVSLYMICSGGNIYVIDEIIENKFFCEPASSKFANGKILMSVESSSFFSYDHWIDTMPEDTAVQNNIYQHLMFDKNTGLRIGQTDNKFYVNIDADSIDFHGVDDNGNDSTAVSVGFDSATVQNATLSGSNGTLVENNATFKKDVSFDGFVWKKESNNSLSLVWPN